MGPRIRYTILLAEPDRELGAVWLATLFRAGYAALAAATGVELFRLLRETVPDVLVLDPVLLAGKLRPLFRGLIADYRYRTLRIILIIQRLGHREIAEMRTLAACDYILNTKLPPLEDTSPTEQLLAKIKTLCP
jgi:DNA-binding response OmpR family regulator